ncbi:hypothetical protein GYMLUDRAFT_250880 [Collybiopsis luxurians FD-317 M1]|uniref:RRM domain-containing protein n=1 Tax=Collybiopsis luxurians FD-317 M1 TaxID=944289 RepID=A0A0D0BE65_9AGAR|nr:hypothetical protein GYMLUDRAFT_250880 [Collybiopsis luxurians FD-317 M1]
MYAQHRSLPRINSYHGPKQRVLGNQAGNVAPAWRVNGSTSTALRHQPAASGSKILLSQLPLDVGEREVEELFKKTVGPLKESFLIYNSQGKSKGMAVVTFQRPGDAVTAKNKYDGKYVDGRRPIRIELVSDAVSIPTGPASSKSTPPAPPSLLDRIDKKNLPSISTSTPSSSTSTRINHNLPRQAAAAASLIARAAPSAPAAHQTKRRMKKGPKRLKKQTVQFPSFGNGTSVKSKNANKTREELDQEMEDYRAAASDEL